MAARESDLSDVSNPSDPSDPSGPSLATALSFVAAWRGRTVVVKVGGSLLEAAGAAGRVGSGGSSEAGDRGDPPIGATGPSPGAGTLARDLALLHRAGVRPLLVHGGGGAVTRLEERLGRTARFVDGLRVTDDVTMEAAEMVLSGTANKATVAALEAHGARAVGVSGRDGGLVRARLHPDGLGLGRVGRVERVDPSLLRTLLEGGFLPVLSPVATAPDGRACNVNADVLAAAVAGAVGAEKLVLLTDVEGILLDRGRGPELCPELDPHRARALIADGTVSRGMIPKVEACLDALERGVPRVHILDGRRPHALLLELLTRRGIGTLLRREG